MGSECSLLCRGVSGFCQECDTWSVTAQWTLWGPQLKTNLPQGWFGHKGCYTWLRVKVTEVSGFTGTAPAALSVAYIFGVPFIFLSLFTYEHFFSFLCHGPFSQFHLQQRHFPHTNFLSFHVLLSPLNFLILSPLFKFTQPLSLTPICTFPKFLFKFHFSCICDFTTFLAEAFQDKGSIHD